MKLSITTTKFNNDQGAPKVKATAGKRQKTVNYDLSKSSDWNHGQAAGALLLSVDEKDGSNLSTQFVMGLHAGTVDHQTNDTGGKHSFTLFTD